MFHKCLQVGTRFTVKMAGVILEGRGGPTCNQVGATSPTRFEKFFKEYSN